MTPNQTLHEVHTMVADIRERVARVEERLDGGADINQRVVVLELWRAGQRGSARVLVLAWHFAVAACGGLAVWALSRFNP